MLQHVRRVIAAGAALYRLGSTGPAGRAHFRGVHARPPHHHHHHAEGILPFIHFLMRSNETVFGRVPELRVLAAASLRLTRLQTAARPPTIRPSRPGPPPPPHFCATGLAEFIPEQPPRGQKHESPALFLVSRSDRWVKIGGKPLSAAGALLHVHTRFHTVFWSFL